MSATLKELADRLEMAASYPRVWLTLASILRDIAAEMRSMEAQPVNVLMLDALREADSDPATSHSSDCSGHRYEDAETYSHFDLATCDCIVAKLRAILAAEAAPVLPAATPSPVLHGTVVSHFCLKCHAEFSAEHPLCCDEGTDANGSINGVCAKCCDGRLHGKDEAAPVPESADAGLLKLAKEIETHCPCGARPESPRTHPHVLHCPVAKLVRALESRYGAAQKAEKA